LRTKIEKEKGEQMAKASMAPEPSYAELKARLAVMEKQHNGTREIEFRVGEKGGVSVYGLGRFPVTLYYEQWIQLLGKVDPLRKFLEAERSKGHLKMKGE
jgi:hypothetical protein